VGETEMSAKLGRPTPPVIGTQTWPWFGEMYTPSPRKAAKRTWRLPVGLLTASIGPLFGSNTTSVAWPARLATRRPLVGSTTPQVRAGAGAPPRPAVGATEGRVDDDVAARRRPRVDQDLERRRAHERVVALGERLGVVGAVQQRPGRPAVHRPEEPDAAAL